MGLFRGRKRSASSKYKILIIAEDGETLYWHKHGQLHLVEEDVATAFVRGFKPDLFQVAPDGSLQPPESGFTKAISRVEMRRA